MSLVKNIVALCCLSAVLSGCGAASKSVSSPANNNSAPSVSLEHKEALKTISEREAAISAKLGRKDMSSDHSGRSFMTIASPKRQLKATPRHHSRTASSYKNIEGKRYDYNYSYRDSWGEIDGNTYDIDNYIFISSGYSHSEFGYYGEYFNLDGALTYKEYYFESGAYNANTNHYQSDITTRLDDKDGNTLVSGQLRLSRNFNQNNEIQEMTVTFHEKLKDREIGGSGQLIYTGHEVSTRFSTLTLALLKSGKPHAEMVFSNTRETWGEDLIPTDYHYPFLLTIHGENNEENNYRGTLQYQGDAVVRTYADLFDYTTNEKIARLHLENGDGGSLIIKIYMYNEDGELSETPIQISE